MPFGDGEGYVCRAFALYGYLHSGQWRNLGELFTSPKQVLAPLHYWIFFLVPQNWAGPTSYCVIQLLCTYLLLAFAIWKICHVLQRDEWAPGVFLLSGVQNFSMDYAYSFHMDMVFFASEVMAVAWQLDAWKKRRLVNSVLSGLGPGLLFWIKPANAFLFLAFYLISEAIYLCFRIRELKVNKGEDNCLRDIISHAKGMIIGFFPTVVAALFCGAWQSIILLIKYNEVSEIMRTTVSCTGLLRLFYFPVCLAYFYHVEALIIILIVGIIGARLVTKASPTDLPGFRLDLLLPIVIAYLILGEFYSFVMVAKTLRSLLLILPILWIILFWTAERYQIRASTLCLVALTYVTVAFSHLYFNFLGPSDPNSTETFSPPPEDYQLTGTWLRQMPEPWNKSQAAMQLNLEVCEGVRRYLPQGGKVGVNTDKIYFNDRCLHWVLDRQSLLEGKPEPYNVTSLFDASGTYFPDAFLESNMLIILSCPNFQTNEIVAVHSMNLLNFSANEWRAKDKVVKIALLPMYPNMPLGYQVIFETPMTSVQMRNAMEAISASEAPVDPRSDMVSMHGHRFTWKEAWQILWQWKIKRFG